MRWMMRKATKDKTKKEKVPKLKSNVDAEDPEGLGRWDEVRRRLWAGTLNETGKDAVVRYH